MIEALVLLAGVVVTLLGCVSLWRALRGPAKGRMLALRWISSLIVALVLVGGGAWAHMRHRGRTLLDAPVTRVDTAKPLVALTFDDGPTPEELPGVLDLLEKEGVRATFFAVGQELERHPELGRRIVAEGHELANHSYSHRRMVFLSLDEIRSELSRTDALIRAAGQQDPIHFRPPYGKRLLLLPYALSQASRAMVLWDVEPDSDEAASAEQIVADVAEHAQAGSVVLLHAMYPSRAASRRALPGVIAALRAKGLQFVTIGELLAAGGSTR